MSDTNDKKPIPPIPGWPSSNEQGQPKPDAGQAIEDPLAELDRIVNQDFDFAASPKGQPAAVSQEELRELEQELIRELRLQQGLDAASRPSEPVAEREPDPITRPHPLARQVPQASAPQASAPQAPQPASVPSQDFSAGLRGSQPESFEMPKTAEEKPAAQPEDAPLAPPVAASPRYEPTPAASDAPAAPTAAERRAPSLDDWSSLIRGGSTESPAERPAAPAVSARDADDVATSGSYGQLRRPSQREAAPSYQSREPVREENPADPMSGFRPGQAAPDSVSLDRSARQTRQEEQASWSQPARESAPDYPSAAPQEPESYVHQPVPEVRAPVASDPASDPFAAFNQAPAQPSSHYPDPMLDRAPVAPAVDVSGREHGYSSYPDQQPQEAGYENGYQDQDAHYQQQPYAQSDAYAAQQGGYAAPNDYPMASGPHGTYADPGVAQAAAESSPYLGDEDYSALGPDMTTAQPPKQQKSRKGLITALAAVGVIAVGGLIAWGFGQSDSDSTETPVVEANTGPVKEVPDDPGGKVIPNQNAAVYDRIDGTKSDEGPSTLMPATEKPLALTRDGQAPRVISLSGGETNVAQNGDTDASTNPVRPKEVRTVVVRPDGTIVTANSGDTANQTQAPSVDQQLLNQTPSEQAMNSTFNNGIEQGGLLQGTDANANTNTDANVNDAGNAATGLPLPRAKPDELVALQQAAQAAAPAQPVAQQPASNSPTLLVPQSTPAQPVPPRPVAQANNDSLGGYTVQITSQRTPDQARASFANIQARLPILNGYQPDIKEANLGDRGTFYRVRVGQFGDRAGATAFCQSIKNAGGDCLVATR
ncbi:hypothetical protein FDK21_05410 [Cohaesibacter sp. CAU 1516]|uniref:SPOR domain-containing protein n=1 Tax=Cohaesibacter sp. CAU 1516 TaxID=2576038 RepID=UPI0010FE6C39|nr:SPOR domain-containing protein [Cohaesibacter sp. CAU 1516]TLP49076.1 hypothetical protein FDK21_05410 [Cohaesibacter sp. CAU 1516]